MRRNSMIAQCHGYKSCSSSLAVSHQVGDNHRHQKIHSESSNTCYTILNEGSITVKTGISGGAAILEREDHTMQQMIECTKFYKEKSTHTRTH